MTIKKHELELNQETDLYKIVSFFSSHIDKVKFALFCAKDCFHLNYEIYKPLVQKCIQLVEKWLIDPNFVTKKQLTDAANATYAVNVAYTVAAAAHAAYTAAVYTAAAAHAARAAYTAIDAYAVYANIKQQKRIQYTNYAYSLLRYTTTTNLQTQGKITDKVTLMALLDELSELNEDLILYQNDKVTLNHPDKITTNTLLELIDIIWTEQSYLLHYLEHLYDHSQT